MESHEEKLHNMIKLSKMESAKDQARDAEKTIRRQRDQQKGTSMQGIGSGSNSVADSQSGLLLSLNGMNFTGIMI